MCSIQYYRRQRSQRKVASGIKYEDNETDTEDLNDSLSDDLESALEAFQGNVFR